VKAYFLAISVFLGVWNVKAQDISVSVGTTIPYQHYAGITLETNRLDVSYNAGILIPPYSDMILNILDDIGVDEVYINLLDASYQFGFTNSLGLNYKMGKNRRWYVGANFRIDHLTASDTPSDLIEIVTGETLNIGNRVSTGAQVEMGLTMYAAGMQLGHLFHLDKDGKHKIRTGLVLAKHLATQSSLSFAERNLENINTELDTLLWEDVFKDYGFIGGLDIAYVFKF